MNPIPQVKFPPIDFPPPAPIPWLLMAIILGLLVPATVWLLWPKRKGRFFDVYLWSLLALPLLFIFQASEVGFAAHSIVYDGFTLLLVLWSAAGVGAALLRLDKQQWQRLLLTAPLLIVLACLIPPVRTAREASRRSQCKNNLKQLGLGLHNYHDTYGTFAAPAINDVSWRVKILPFVDHAPFYQLYNQSIPWNEGENLEKSRTRILWLQCPSRTAAMPDQPSGQIDYAVPIGHLGIFETADSTPNLKDIGDGASNTLAYVEAGGRNIIWNEPRDVNFDELPLGINLPGPRAGESFGVISGYHHGGAQVTFADGAARMLAETIDPQVLKRLLMANDGEKVGNF